MRPHILHSGLHRIGDRINHFIDPERFLGRGPHDDSWLAPTKKPLVNLRETDQHFDLEVALPGFSRDEITLTIHDTSLIIEAKKEQEEDTHNVIRSEFSTQQLKRIFNLPPNIDGQRIKATFNHGVLSIRLPYSSQVSSNTIAVH